MAKLGQLFELQKFAENKELEDIINETHSRYSDNLIELDENDLGLVAAGIKREAKKERPKI